MNPQVSIIMGSTSDMPIMEEAAKILEEFNIYFEINALSAHPHPTWLWSLQRMHMIVVYVL